MFNAKAFSPFFLGFFCLGFQIIIIREFSSVFWGNEFHFGIILGFWLFWEGLGALLAEKVNLDEKHIYKIYLLLIFLFLISLYFIRWNRFLLHTLPGEIQPFLWVLFVSALSSSLVSLLLGVLFVMNVKLMDGKLGFTYILESIGSAVGSLFVYFAVVPNMSNWMGIAVISIIGIFALLLIFRPNLIWNLISIFLIFSLLFFGFLADAYSIKRYWSPLKLILSKDSKFGKISVVEEKGEISVYENSMLSFSSHEREGAEESIHIPFLTAKSLKEVLIIGGGFGGILWEASKYKNTKIEYLEFDPEIIGVTKTIDTFKRYFEEKRISFHIGDPRGFLRKERKRWDCIVMSLPEPINAQINRLYTREFYELIKNKLKEDGIFSFKVSSSGEYINRDLQRVLSIHYLTLKKVFPHVNYLPGDRCIFLASEKPFEIKYESILEKKEKIGIETLFINERYLRMRMSPIRYAMIESAIKTESRVNSDFNPSLYLFHLNYLSGYHGKFEKKIYDLLTSAPRFWIVDFPLIGFLFLLLIHFIKKRTSFYMLPVFGIGLTTLSIEILFVISYQILFGYFYGRIALLFFFFMMGLAMGSLYTKIFLRPLPKLLSIFQFLMLSLSFASFIIFQSKISFLSSGFFHTLIFLLLFLYGAVSGSIFIIANELFIKKKEKRFGLGWAVDLGGSTIGAISISTVLLPVLGFVPILKLFLLLNLAIFLFILGRGNQNNP